MKPTIKPKRTAEQQAKEEAIRRQHAVNPIHQRPVGSVNQQSFTAILRLLDVLNVRLRTKVEIDNPPAAVSA